MVFNATYNNISVISRRSVLLVSGNRRKPPTCRMSLTNFTWCCIVYTSAWARFELTTLVLIGTDCTGSCKSNYLTITTTTAPVHKCISYLKFSLVSCSFQQLRSYLLEIFFRSLFIPAIEIRSPLALHTLSCYVLYSGVYDIITWRFLCWPCYWSDASYTIMSLSEVTIKSSQQ